MSTILSKDSTLTFPSTIVVSASAGSGKTYTLTQRFVQLLLSDRVPHNGLRNILAITFTNQAASEMRTRLMEYLKALSLGDSERIAEAAGFLDMGGARIREKAEAVLQRILGEFSDLQIRTIDSFMATVFRTSAFEFGFQPDLDIVFDTRPLLAEAFAKLTRERRSRPELRETLEGTVRLISETRPKHATFLWDPYSRIQYEVRKLYSRLAARERKILSGSGLAENETIKNSLRTLARSALDRIESSGFEPYSRVETNLNDLLDGEPDRLFSRKLMDREKIIKRPNGGIRLEQYEATAAALSHEIDRILEEIQHFAMWHAENHFQPYIDAIGFVDGTLTRLKRERGEIFIDDINKLLRPHLRESGAVDAYLMLGEQIHHFLIDEFQDTSPIQWANLMPLIENSLAQGGSLFVVGDRRQSIYAFRDADWRIMDRLMKKEYFAAAPAEVLPLDVNWRSYEKVIDYTTRVFEDNVAHSSFAVSAALSGLLSVKQTPKPEHRGRGLAEVITLEYDEENPPERKEVIALIDDCVKRGYALSDIAVLTPQNDRVMEISTWLNQRNIGVLPFSSLDIRSRKVIGEILALLRFLDSPVDDLAFGTVLLGKMFEDNLVRDDPRAGVWLHTFMVEAGRSPDRRRLYTKFREQYPKVWESYFDALFQLVGYLPLYDLLSELYRKFRLFELCESEEASLVRLLEVVRHFSESDRNGLKDFLAMAGEEGEQSVWQVQVPREVNAVRVMTVHKSKGLEFPVTIVVQYDRDVRWSRYFFHDTDAGTRILSINTKSKEMHPLLLRIYEDRKQSDEVDHLNKLYVSLTRAQHELFVIAVKGSRDPFFPSSVLGAPDGQLELRPIATVERKPDRESARSVHIAEPVSYDEPMVRILAVEEMARGEFIHRILAGIEFLDGPPEDELERLVKESRHLLPPGLDPDAVRSDLMQFLSTEAGAGLFRRRAGRVVRTEAEFISASGDLFRMDRLVIDPDAATVIDFKTGQRPASEYRQQMDSYLRILRDVYPGLRCDAMLAYIDGCVVEAMS